MYVITQGSGPSSLNASLAESLSAQPWADVVSPEILSLGTVRGTPVILRAGDPAAILRIDGGRWTEAPPADDGIAAGMGVAARLGLQVGDFVTLVGSTIPRLEVVPVRGLFDAEGPARDEFLADTALGRSLTGLGADAYHTIRVRTSDPDALLSFLVASRASVHVSGPGLPRADVGSDPPTEDRLTNLILRSGRGSVPRDYVAVAIAEATASVRVVAFGLAGLVGVLVALSIHSVQARAFADKSRAVGVLRAVGATDRWMRRRVVLEGLPLAAIAGALGAGIGLALDFLLRPSASLVLFGHEVRATFDVGTFVLVVVAVVLASSASHLGLLRRALRRHPWESMRDAAAMEPVPSLEGILRG